MKKILVLILVGFVFLAGCSNPNEPEISPPPEDLVGTTWRYKPNPYHNYDIIFETATTGNYLLYYGEGDNDQYDNLFTYSYCKLQNQIVITGVFEEQVSGSINADTLTLTVYANGDNWSDGGYVDLKYFRIK